ncbi:hypothetical protein [Massilia mucilaginosa]|uniref:hypothetical protein n=1 Tax=Massilia mucilaginosa TaxID=2609282 RepID=UPI00141E1C89|nr:hypothetical protein [Massilia mucilaginosa]
MRSSLSDDVDELQLPDELDEPKPDHDDEELELGLESESEPGLELELGPEQCGELDESELYDDKLVGLEYPSSSGRLLHLPPPRP